MGIVTESYVPKLILQLNSIQKMVNYRGIEREITQTYWTDYIGPLLYPNWDTDKDKLIQLNYYDTGAFHAKRRKFVKNFSTGEYEWKDYEMELGDTVEAKAIFDKLKEAFYLMDSVEKESFQKELSESYYQSRNVSWYSIRLVRNFLLDDSDWVFQPDSGISEEERALWIKYRQNLRDVPQIDAYTEPTDVKFPISPQDWKYHYQPTAPEGEEYLGSVNQFIKLSGFLINNFKERIVQYLVVRQSVMNPMNYRDYANRMSSPQPWPTSSDEFVNQLLTDVSASEEGV